MITVGAFAIAAAAGTLLRWELGEFRLGRPRATLLVNVVGAFLLGLLAGWDAPAITIVGVAGLGSLTTFSALADEMATIWGDDRRTAVGYVVITMAAGIGAAGVGLALAG